METSRLTTASGIPVADNQNAIPARSSPGYLSRLLWLFIGDRAP